MLKVFVVGGVIGLDVVSGLVGVSGVGGIG